MRKIVLTYGLIAGAVLSAMMFLTFATFHDKVGYDNGAIIGYTTMVLAFLMIYFGVRSYRDDIAGGQITFGRAFKVGILIMALASVCYVASWQVVYRKFAPDFGEKYAAYTLEKARQEGATEAELAAKKTEQEEFWKMYENPLVNIAFTFLEPLPVGLVMTLVTAGLLSRKRREDGALPENVS